jgi:hypothetical protein
MLICIFSTDFTCEINKGWNERVRCIICGMFYPSVPYRTWQIGHTGTSQHDHIVTLRTCKFGFRWIVARLNNVVAVNYKVDIGRYIPIGKRLEAAIKPFSKYRQVWNVSYPIFVTGG